MFKMNVNKLLITGGAGFVGFHLAQKLASTIEAEIYLIDNINAYYDVKLKLDRLGELGFDASSLNSGQWVKSSVVYNLYFCKGDICNTSEMESAIQELKFEVIIHLAAQAGVRYSLEAPDQYIQSNIIGFFNILGLAKKMDVQHFIFASSSSVYGNNSTMPFAEDLSVMQPLNLYAATKSSNELMAYAYAHLYGIPCSGLRFFTVYGPFGRPDMAYYKFAKKMLAREVIDVYSNGKMKRDFTYIDDITESISRLIPLPPTGKCPFEMYNIGNSSPVELIYFIELLEQYLDVKASIKFIPSQTGEMVATYADIDKLGKKINFKPQVSIEEGLRRFVHWFKSYSGN